jgi:hypothetical protein
MKLRRVPCCRDNTVGEGSRKAALGNGRDKETGADIAGKIRFLNRLVDAEQGDKCGHSEIVGARLRNNAVKGIVLDQERLVRMNQPVFRDVQKSFSEVSLLFSQFPPVVVGI